MKTITLKSNEIHCESCAASVRKALSAVEGVLDIRVDVKNKTVVVEFEDPAEAEVLHATMQEAGFPVIK